MLARNSSSGGMPKSSSKSIPNSNTNSIPNPTSQGKSRVSSSKQSVIGVSNISVSIRSTKKATDRSAKIKAQTHSDTIEVSKAEKGIQVNDVQINAIDGRQPNEEGGDVPLVIILPSPKVLREVERMRRLKKEKQLKERLSETRHFEEHEKKQESHLTNLQKFLDTGAVERKRHESPARMLPPDESIRMESKKTKEAIGAYDRIKQKEEELLKLFNCL